MIDEIDPIQTIVYTIYSNALFKSIKLDSIMDITILNAPDTNVKLVRHETSNPLTLSFADDVGITLM